MTNEQAKKVAEVLAEKIVSPCSCCGESFRSVVSEMFFLSANAIPLVVLTCMKCGSTEFFNAHVAGLAEILGLPAPEVPIRKVQSANGDKIMLRDNAERSANI